MKALSPQCWQLLLANPVCFFFYYYFLTPGRIVLIQMRCFEWCPEDTAAAPNSPSPPVGLAAQPGPALRGDGGGGSARAGSGGGFVRGVPSPIQWGELQEGARDVQPAAPPHSRGPTRGKEKYPSSMG